MSDSYFADISNYQDPVDLPTYRATNAVIAEQVSWGMSVTDPNGRMQLIRSLNFAVVIWYIGLVGNEDIGDQVNVFINALGGLLPNETIVIDWEATGNINPPSPQQREQAANLLAQHYGIGRNWIGTYASTSLIETSPPPSWIWVASYETPEPSVGQVAWQFTNGVYPPTVNFPGIGLVDGSVYHMTYQVLATDICPFASGGPTPPPPPPPPPPPWHATVEGVSVSVIPFQATCNSEGWMAMGVTLPAGKTKDDVISVMMDIGTAKDGAWNWCEGQVDYLPVTPGFCVVGMKGQPNGFYTGRVICTD